MHPVLFHLGSLLIPTYGALGAVGVLLALGLAQRTAPRCGLDARHAWNMIVLAVFASIALSRLVLIAVNLGDLQRHPRWLLAIAMVHHPLLAAVGLAGAVIAVLIYTRWAHLRSLAVADCLAAPLFAWLSAEQVGALMAGSDYGRDFDSISGWSVTYTSPIAARWSGTPLGVPLYPVQAYTAAGALVIACLLLLWQRRLRAAGDATGTALVALGSLLFVTELFRDWEGRAVILGGAADLPQVAALAMVIAGGLLLLNWRAEKKPQA